MVDTAADVRDAKQLRERNKQYPEFGQFIADRQKTQDEINTYIKEIIVPAMKSLNVEASQRRKRQAGEDL